MDQLSAFVGMTFNYDDRFWIVWQAAIKCTLKDIIFEEEFNLNKDFLASFLHDLVKVESRN